MTSTNALAMPAQPTNHHLVVTPATPINAVQTVQTAPTTAAPTVSFVPASAVSAASAVSVNDPVGGQDGVLITASDAGVLIGDAQASETMLVDNPGMDGMN